MPESPQEITFLVPGQEAGATRGLTAELPAEIPNARVKQSVRIGSRRAAGAEVRVTALPGEDAVLLHIAGGPTLTLHPECAFDLMQAQKTDQEGEPGSRRGPAGARVAGTPAAANTVSVPAQLQWSVLEEGVETTRGVTRGWLGKVLLSRLEVITFDKAADLTAAAVAKRVDAQVNAGVYRLSSESLPNLKESGQRIPSITTAPDGPMLVLIHGTFSTTSSSFGKLWSHHPDRVRSLFDHYKGQVYALDHPTLGASPIENALTLVEALPPGAHLHLLTHSRGGLVAEVLARVCGNPHEDFQSAKSQQDRADLKALAARVKEKNIRVERLVRVACPARGTLLASKRLDAYLSVFKWTLDLAGIPVAPEVLDFLAAVAKRREDADLLPGLAAQIPDSPLVQWLHSVQEPIRGDLRVIAGDMQGDSVVSWLKTLMADSFYWTDNDLIVHTRSMYGGLPRAEGATFVFDQGSDVSHFNYFRNDRTAGAIVGALIQDTPPQEFRTIGPLSWAGQSSTGVRAARRDLGKRPAHERPALFLLPGIAGSNLKVDKRRIWVGWRLINGLDQLDIQARNVEADGPIDAYYKDLAELLSETHDVIEFGFDWRVRIELEARRLAKAVTEALDARAKTDQPVRILAHSMGGIVARTLQLEAPEVWNRMMAHSGARLLMLGTPNGGSWAPMQVLSGDDSFGNMLALIGAPFQEKDARDRLARFPGLLQLQADLETLDTRKKWEALATRDRDAVIEKDPWHFLSLQKEGLDWGLPDDDTLKLAKDLRQRLDRQKEQDLPKFKDKLLLVVGQASATPNGYDLRENGLVYLDIPGGDGRVTRESALLPGVRTWTVNSGHADLPRERLAFEAYRELLETGTTRALAMLSPAAEVPIAMVTAPSRSRPSRTVSMTRPPQGESEILEPLLAPAAETGAPTGAALQITVLNGDLTFIRHPLLVGHYSSMRLTGTEHVMDRRIGGAMGEALRIGLYPEAPRTHQIFTNTVADPQNPWRTPRPVAVIVVGLGEEGKLSTTELAGTVRQAVLAWAQRLTENPAGAPGEFELAATLIGSGGTGITLSQSAQSIAQGVQEANKLLDEMREDFRRTAERPRIQWPRVSHLYLVELYLDRATEAWRALQLQEEAYPARYKVSPVVQCGEGALPRPLDSGYRGADYDFISAVSKKDVYGEGTVIYTLDTKRARTEVRAQKTQGRLLRNLIERASNDQNTDPQIGRTLFNLLVPVEMEPFLAGTTEMQIEVDGGTAGIPWELLDTPAGGSHDSRPWAIRTKLLRKLRTAEFRSQVMDASTDARILVIGEPACDRSIYPRLPGARLEARAVVDRLIGPGGIAVERVVHLISPDNDQIQVDALTVIKTVFSQSWRIVHISGHGEPPERIEPGIDPGSGKRREGDPRGVVLSDGTFLGPREVKMLRTVPELVFVNCCYLAARNVDQLFESQCPEKLCYDRPQFAATIAEELIKLGVRCVIAAGWAVQDDAAKSFAITFYDALLRGRRFLDAVGEARQAAYREGDNTWAAYQCYGDPDWSFQPSVGDAQGPRKLLTDEFAGVASPRGLVLALETIQVKSRYQNARPEEQRARLRHLEARFAPLWGDNGEVAEAFGRAWSATNDFDTAVQWLERAVAANDGSASIAAAELRAHLIVKRAWKAVDQALDPERSQEILGSTVGAIQQAIGLMKKIIELQPTMERHSLVGSAYKRLALLHRMEGNQAEQDKAVKQMEKQYSEAEKLGKRNRDPELFKPQLSQIAAEIVGGKGASQRLFRETRQNLDMQSRDNPRFWSIAGSAELRTYKALFEGNLQGEASHILAEYEDLHSRISSPDDWRSILEQARFVLESKRVSESPEAQEAERILDRLQSLAGPGPDAT
jgi:pimeloyl-ACP methyl ester carboxylesterase/tetratricopeptide (TPR) repeat protein